MRTLKKLIHIVIKLTKLWLIFIVVLVAACISYKLSPHRETNQVDGVTYEAYWKGAKVYKLLIYKNENQYPTSMFLYSRQNVRYLATPQLRWHPHPTIADEYFIDSNGDGKWDEIGRWRYPGNGYKVQKDTNYDGKYDEEYVIEGIM